MTERMNKIVSFLFRKKNLFFLFFISVSLLSFPFLEADPDANLSLSRDAFTDEGLNTSQIRNLVLGHPLDIMECDNFIKAPLFQTYMGGGFAIFGISLPIARIWAFIGTFAFIALAYFRSGDLYKFTLIAAAFSIMNYVGFQYLHFSMAESMASAAILWMGIEFYRAATQTQTQTQVRIKHWLLPALALWICISLKNQFFYLLAVYAIWILIYAFYFKISPFSRSFYYPIIPMILGAVAYLLLVYLPMKEAYDSIMQHQTSNRWIAPQYIFQQIKLNIQTSFLHQGMKLLFSGTLLFSIWVLILKILEPKDPKILLFFMLFAWVAIELHKFGIRFTPTRYVVSTVWAFASLLAMSLYLFRTQLPQGKNRLLIPLLVLLPFVFPYIHLFKNRSYTIKEANLKMEKMALTLQPDYIIGPWAAGLSWNCDIKSVPVWKDFLNGSDFLEKYPHSILVSEEDEDDNNKAFSAKGIRIPDYSLGPDSVFIRGTKIYFQALTSSEQ